MRRAPSRRITSPLRRGFSMMVCTRWAYSSGSPNRFGNGIVSARKLRTLSGRPSSSGVRNSPVQVKGEGTWYIRVSHMHCLLGWIHCIWLSNLCTFEPGVLLVSRWEIFPLFRFVGFSNLANEMLETGQETHPNLLGEITVMAALSFHSNKHRENVPE